MVLMRLPGSKTEFDAGGVLLNGVPFDITTFPVSDPVAQALGAKALDAEESVNYSLGTVFRIGGVSVTIDGYRIEIDDRIVVRKLDSRKCAGLPDLARLYWYWWRPFLYQRRRYRNQGC
jgi:hypothetical protein